MLDKWQRASLDRYITGNYGEDYYKDALPFCKYDNPEKEECTFEWGNEICLDCCETCPHYEKPIA
jgi:hypothetical protein